MLEGKSGDFACELRHRRAASKFLFVFQIAPPKTFGESPVSKNLRHSQTSETAPILLRFVVRKIIMPNGEIPVSNPPPLPSHLPDNILDLVVKIERAPLPDDVRDSLRSFQRAACYIAAGEFPSVPVIRGLADQLPSHDLLARQCSPRV